jgi:hypothetical protein
MQILLLCLHLAAGCGWEFLNPSPGLHIDELSLRTSQADSVVLLDPLAFQKDALQVDSFHVGCNAHPVHSVEHCTEAKDPCLFPLTPLLR